MLGLTALAGVTDPEEKRKIIGREFIRSFEGAAREIVAGAVTAERLEILRRADAIARAELSAGGLDRELWQCQWGAGGRPPCRRPG